MVGRNFLGPGLFAQRHASTYRVDPPSFPVCPCWVECSKDLLRSNQPPIRLAPLLDGGAYHFGSCESFPTRPSPLISCGGGKQVMGPLSGIPVVGCLTHGINNLPPSLCYRRHMDAFLHKCYIMPTLSHWTQDDAVQSVNCLTG